MKKLIFLIVSVLLLTGCTVYNYDFMKNSLDDYLSKANESLDIRANNHTEYYSYYLPSDMVEKECFDESIVFGYSNSRIVLNINIAGMIARSHYQAYSLADEGLFDEDKLIYEKGGTYSNIDTRLINYFVKIYEGDTYYMIHLMSDEVNMYAYTLKEEAYETTKHMFLLARSTSVKADELLAGYTATDIVNAERKQVDLFQYVIPKQGYLSELSTNTESEEK